MQYLGGKTRIAKHIAPFINENRNGRTVWDPFCGGLSVASELAKEGPVIASDIMLPLISLYRALQCGWKPPEFVSEEDYHKAKSLPDTNPLKAFIGFGCSFGGKYFGGYARSGNCNFAEISGLSLQRKFKNFYDVSFHCMSFFDQEPFETNDLIIYCDPPYAGTTKYKNTGEFDRELFWQLVIEWEKKDVPVFVSEYSCPVDHKALWSKNINIQIAKGIRPNRNTEHLFRVIV